MSRLRTIYFVLPLVLALGFVVLTTSMLSATAVNNPFVLETAAAPSQIELGDTAVFTVTLVNTSTMTQNSALSLTVSGPIDQSQFDLVESNMANTQFFNQPPNSLRWGGQLGQNGSLTVRVTVKTLPFIDPAKHDYQLRLDATAGTSPFNEPLTATVSLIEITPPAGMMGADFTAVLLDQQGNPLLTDENGNHLQLPSQPVRAQLILTNTGTAPLVSLLTGGFTAVPDLDALADGDALDETNNPACRARLVGSQIRQGDGFLLPPAALGELDGDYAFLVTTPPGETTIVESLVRPLGGLDCALTYQNEARSRALPADFERTVPPNPRIVAALRDLTPAQAALLTLILRASDYGDAPASLNSYGNTPMTAYAGVTANFPTVADGPLHRFVRPMHLGPQVSPELLPDRGWGRNLNPPADLADLDLWDDGLASTAIALGHCQTTLIPVTVSFSQFALDLLNNADQTAYLNVWLDGNRDGDWNDVFSCDGLQATEHIVIDQPILPATAGQHTLMIPTRILPIPLEQVGQEMWLRLSLSDAPSVKTGQVTSAGQVIDYGDGRGPVNGFRLGETEDYLINPDSARGGHLVLAASLSAWQDLDDEDAGEPALLARPLALGGIRNFFSHRVTIRNLGGLPTNGKLIIETTPYLGLPEIASGYWDCLTCTFTAVDTFDTNTVNALSLPFEEVCPVPPHQCYLELALDSLSPGQQGDIFLRWKVEEGEAFRIVDFATRVETVGVDDPLPGSTFAGKAQQVIGAPQILRPLNGVFRPTMPYTGSNEALTWVVPQVMIQGQPGATAVVRGNGLALREISFDAQGMWRGSLPTPADDVSLAVVYTAVPGLPPVAVPQLDKATPLPLRLNDTLPWNPASMGTAWTGCLTCTLRTADSDPAPLVPIMDANGWIEIIRWRIPFVPNVESEVGLDLTDMPPDTPVALRIGNQPPFPFTHMGDGHYRTSFTLPAMANGAEATLIIGCDGFTPDAAPTNQAVLNAHQCWTYTGSLQQVNPVTVANRLTGDPIAEAQVGMWQYRRTAQGPQALFWPADAFGQTNPVLTDNAGQFRFVMPRGFYGVTVRKDGYQPFRYGPLPFTGSLPAATIGLTPLPPQARATDQSVVEVDFSEAGFPQAVLEISPGTAVEFTNLSGEFIQLLDAPNAPDGVSNANSGLLTPGESYQFMFDTMGSYLLTNGEDPSQQLLVRVQEAQIPTGMTIFLPLVTR